VLKDKLHRNHIIVTCDFSMCTSIHVTPFHDSLCLGFAVTSLLGFVSKGQDVNLQSLSFTHNSPHRSRYRWL